MPLTSGSMFLLDLVNRPEAKRFHTLSTEQGRRAFQKTQATFQPEPRKADVAEALMQRLPLPALRFRLYRAFDRAGKDKLPVLIWFHGGGWCLGDLDYADTLCRDLCIRAGCAVISVDYRLAPENPFPAAVDDARFACEWVVAHADKLSIDPERIALGGDSAGGNLAVVSALSWNTRGKTAPRLLVLVYPSVEAQSHSASMQRYGSGYLLDRESLEWFYSRYVPGSYNCADWRLSPLHAPSMAELPRILLINAEYDPLTDDCSAFAQRVRNEGGTVEQKIVPGVIHSYLTLGKLFPEAEESIALMGRTLQQHL